MKKTICLIAIIATIQSGCNKPLDEGFDRKPNGQLQLSSALILHTFQKFPLGKTSKEILDSVKYSTLLKSFSILPEDIFSLQRLPPKQSDLMTSEKFEQSIESSVGHRIKVIYHFYQDTAAALSIEGNTENETHIDAIIRNINARFGSPKSEETGLHTCGEEAIKYYWHKNGYSAEIIYGIGSKHNYFLIISDIQKPLYLIR